MSTSGPRSQFVFKERNPPKQTRLGWATHGGRPLRRSNYRSIVAGEGDYCQELYFYLIQSVVHSIASGYCSRSHICQQRVDAGRPAVGLSALGYQEHHPFPCYPKSPKKKDRKIAKIPRVGRGLCLQASLAGNTTMRMVGKRRRGGDAGPHSAIYETAGV
jgi:hypothetical protein